MSDLLRDASVFHDDITGLPTLSKVQVEVQRRLFDHSQLGILYVTLDGVHPLEQIQGFEVVDDVFRVIARRLTEARGVLLRDEDFVSVSSLGNGFLIVLSPPRDRGVLADEHLVSVKRRLERDLIDGLERDLKADLLATVGLYVGHARLTQSPKVRFRRALLEAINAATRTIETERSELRHRLDQQFDEVLSSEQISCVHQPIVRLDGYGVMGYELLARGPMDGLYHSRRALRRGAAAGSRRRARPPVPHGSYGLQRAAATRVPALHQHRSTGAVLPFPDPGTHP